VSRGPYVYPGMLEGASAAGGGGSGDIEEVIAGAGLSGGGASGAVTLTANADCTFYGIGLSGDFTAVNATLAASVYYEDYDIPAGVTVKTANYGVYCVTVSVSGTLHNDGNAAVVNAGGIATGVGAWASATVVGGAGGTAAGSAGTNVTNAVGGAGGAGGAGSGGGGGAGGTVTAPSAARGSIGISSIPYYCFVAQAAHAGASTTAQFSWGAGGGGGGGDGTAGGGGGGGGGGVLVAAKTITVEATGVISADGGAGGTPAGGNRGSGGGGGGGAVFLFYQTLTNAGAIRAAGGAPGTPTGTGVIGSSGSAGIVRQFQV
jgi:hypothetical protein